MTAARVPKRVFILGGGASLGAHQVGALKRLEEEGVVPDAIVASSIGVINACVYATGGVEHLERAWVEFGSVGKLLRPSLRHNLLAGLSLISMDPIAAAVERFVDFDKIHASPLDLSFILLNLTRGEGQFLSNRDARSPAELRTLSRAGYAIPLLFPPVRYRGEYYADGGFAWNVPILQAIEMGATEVYVLAVISTSLPYKRTFRGLPDYVSRLADVMWRTIGNVGYVTTRVDRDGTYGGVPVIAIQPTEQHAGFSPMSLLSSSPGRSRRLITAGYTDTKRELERRRRAARAHANVAGADLEVEPAFRHRIA